MFHSKRSYWRKLDNAAKLFPATSNKKDTRVFRFYCIMKEDVREEILQQAVEKALEKYPLFLSVMRKGLFWHYLEKSNLKPVVTEEFKEPCSNLYVRDKKSLLFEVTYYKRRINFEVFHVLTDGTGATCFLKEIVKHYIVLAYGEADISLDKEHITIQDQESAAGDRSGAVGKRSAGKGAGISGVDDCFFDGSIPLCDPQGDAEKTGKASGCSDGPGESSQFFSFRFDAEFLRIY